MKKILLILIVFLITFSVKAQWYYYQYNVNDIDKLTEPELELAMRDAEMKISTGKSLTFIGAGLTFIGTGITFLGDITLDRSKYSATTRLTLPNFKGNIYGTVITFYGIIATATGTVIWVYGASKKRDINIALVKLRTNTSMVTPGVSIKFNF